MTIDVNGRPVAFVVRHSTDLRALWEVLGLGEYELPAGADPAVVFDCGAHIGASTVFFALTYPRAEVHAFEPHPESFRLLCENARGLRNVTLHPVAVSDEDGEAELVLADEPWASSLDRSGPKRVRVPVARLDTLQRELGVFRIDVLKLDVEGAERRVMEAYAAVGEIDVVVGELHPEADVEPSRFVSSLGERDVEIRREGDQTIFVARRS